ncbi:MAG: hypothetical protein J6X94_10400 [Lachnospiraceae bacterium]|nr:hypothetical protein [Lachnospiraceae bacterium]
MKKKYLSLVLALLMMASFNLSSCTNVTEEAVEESDENDEAEEIEDEEPVYVDVLDKSDLKDQVKVLVRNREDWMIQGGSRDTSDNAYLVTDLDHNGRLEIIAITGLSDHGLSEVELFEVDEDGKGLDEARWKWKGLDIASGIYPDFSEGAGFFYNRKKTETGYEICNSIAEEGGDPLYIAYEVTYSDGKVVCYNYASAVLESDWVFYTDDGTDISDDDEFTEYLDDYHDDYKFDEISFGIYSEKNYYNASIHEVSDDELKTILTDSYNVFCGEMSIESFDGVYNLPYVSVEPENDLYSALIGKWNLYSISYDGFGTDYYDEDSSDFMTFEFYEDRAVLFSIFYDGEEELSELLSVETEDDRVTVVYEDYEDEFTDEEIGRICFEFSDLTESGGSVLVLISAYDKDGELYDAYLAEFVRADSDHSTGFVLSDRYFGEWELVSTQSEGEVTYYEEGGSYNVTLIVDSDKTATLKEFSYGELQLEISGDILIGETDKPYFICEDKEVVSDPVVYVTYMLMLDIADPDVMEVYVKFYDEDDESIGGSILTFERQSRK